MVEGNERGIKRALHPAYAFYGPGGASTRDDLLEAVSSRRVRFTGITVEELDVRVFGETGVVRARIVATVLDSTEDQTARLDRKLTTTWIPQDRGWQAVAWHASDVDDMAPEAGLR